MKSIFEDTDSLIAKALDLETGQSLRQKSTCIGLKYSPDSLDKIENLVFSLFETIENNWVGRIPSPMNWKLRKKINLNPINQSPEILLERAIAILSEREILPNWYNQIPIVSGLLNEKSDKRAAIDIVTDNNEYAQFIELKWESDNPAYAAFEILRYALAFLFCYKMQDKFHYSDYQLMNVNKIALRVLAPFEYYLYSNLAFLQNDLSKAINRLFITQSQNKLSCDFVFLSFPSDFQLPFSTGEEVSTFMELPITAEPIAKLLSAIANIKPIWQNERSIIL